MNGLAMGPYFMGQLFYVYRARSMDGAEFLQTAIASGLLIFVASFSFWFWAGDTCRKMKVPVLLERESRMGKPKTLSFERPLSPVLWE